MSADEAVALALQLTKTAEDAAEWEAFSNRRQLALPKVKGEMMTTAAEVQRLVDCWLAYHCLTLDSRYPLTAAQILDLIARLCRLVVK